MAETFEQFHRPLELSFHFESPKVCFWYSILLSLPHPPPLPSFDSWDKPRGEMGSYMLVNVWFVGLEDTAGENILS